MNKFLKPITHSACLLALMFVADAQAIIGVAPGGSVVRRHAIVATTTAVAVSSANASAAATANAQAAATKPPPPAAPGAAPQVGSIVTVLPPGCTQTNLNGVAYERCGSTYYQASMMGSNLVFVVAQP